MQVVDESNASTNPLLTIAVPTYNRASYLDLCLKRISEEIAALPENKRCLVNVYVSDNASSDNTPAVVAQYQGVCSGIFESVRNDQNMGLDFNFLQCYESARTPYVWMVGDDDVILPGRLKKVLDFLINNEVDLLYVNNYWFKDSYMEKPKQREKHNTAVFSSALDFTRRTNVMLTYVSGLIVRSGVVSNKRQELNGSMLVLLSWILPLLRDGSRFAVIEDWVVAAKGANTGGYGLIEVFGNNLQKIAADILKDKPDVVRTIQNGTIVNFFTGFILDIRKGASKFSEKDMSVGLRNAFGDNWRYYVFLLPLVLLPLPLARIYNVLLKVFRRLFRSVLV